MEVRDSHAYATALSSTNILNCSDAGWQEFGLARSESHTPVMPISRPRKARTVSSRLKKRDAHGCSMSTGANHEDVSHLLTIGLGSDTRGGNTRTTVRPICRVFFWRALRRTSCAVDRIVTRAEAGQRRAAPVEGTSAWIHCSLSSQASRPHASRYGAAGHDPV